MTDLIESYLIFLQEGLTERVAKYTAAMLSAAAMKMYEDFLNTAQRACEGREGLDKSICEVSIKINGMRRLIGEMKRSVANCEEANNREKCREKMAKKIARQEEKLGKLYKYLSMYRSRAGR